MDEPLLYRRVLALVLWRMIGRWAALFIGQLETLAVDDLHKGEYAKDLILNCKACLSVPFLLSIAVERSLLSFLQCPTHPRMIEYGVEMLKIWKNGE